MRPTLKTRLLTLGVRLILPAIAILVWEILGRRGVINRSVFPYPSRIMETYIEMIQRGNLQKHLIVSAERVIKGFCIGSTLGLGVGAVVGLSRWANNLTISLLGLLRPIPMIAWIPLLILWLGIDEPSKVTLISIGTFWPMMINSSRGIRNCDKKLLEVGIILEKNRWQMLTKVVLPSAFPFIFTGMRLGIGSAWTCVVTAEAIAASAGIGYMIMYARELSQPPVMFAGVITIGLVGLLLDTVLQWVEKRVLLWNEISEN
jgi:sulfonate transport system permease protein